MNIEISKVKDEINSTVKAVEKRVTKCENSNAEVAKLNERVKKLEEVLPTLTEGATADLGSPTFKEMLKKGIKEQVKTVNNKIEKKLEKYQDEDEKKLIEEKKCNIIFFDIPELDSKDIAERISHDRNAFFNLYDIDEDSFDDSTIQNMYRVGPKKDDKTRPLIVRFDQEETKLSYLRKSRDLALGVNGKDQRVYACQDMTKNQRARLKKLKAELKQRKDKGEKVVIRDFQIVKANFQKKKEEEDEEVEAQPVRVSYRSLFVRR